MFCKIYHLNVGEVPEADEISIKSQKSSGDDAGKPKGIGYKKAALTAKLENVKSLLVQLSCCYLSVKEYFF